MRAFFLLGLSLFVYFQTVAQSELRYTWEDEFTEVEKQKVRAWLSTTYKAVQSKIGEYPFDVYVHIHRREGKEEPCPWANTWRYPKQQIFFHIDPNYSLEEFLADWTAPHEMSHLAIPYIGEKEAWFSEGFASFLQYQVMLEMGEMTKMSIDSAYNSKVSGVLEYYRSTESVGDIAIQKRKESNYKAMYWGGANLFYQWNQQLIEKENREFSSLFQEYLKCCRKTSRGVDGVVKAIDEVYGGTIGQDLLFKFRNGESGANFKF